MYLLLAAQQALPAYYFLTAFAPCQRLVGRRLKILKDFPKTLKKAMLQVAEVKVDHSVC